MKNHYCEFDKNLYVGQSLKNLPLVKWKMQHGAGQLSVYAICKAGNPHDQLDIVHCGVLTQKFFRNNPVHVYGLAAGYTEALDMVVMISVRASECGMDGDLLGYLETMGAQEEEE